MKNIGFFSPKKQKIPTISFEIGGQIFSEYCSIAVVNSFDLDDDAKS